MKRFVLAAVLAAAPAAAAPPEVPAASGAVALASSAHAVTLLDSEGAACAELLLDAAVHVTFVLATPVPHEATLRRPDGLELSAGTVVRGTAWHDVRIEQPEALPLPGLGRGANTVVLIEEPQPGPYRACIRSRERTTEPAAFAVTMLPTSDVRLGLALAEPEALAGRPVALGALLLEGERPLERGAVLVATVTRAPDDPREGTPEPRRLELSDRGDTGDAAAGDGLFSGVFVPEVPGRYWVHVHARGESGRGLGFQRDAGGVIVVEESEPLLEGRCDVAVLDGDRDGRFDALRVRVPGNYLRGRTYDVVVELRAPSGQATVAHTLVREDARSVVDVDFPREQVRALGSDGPFMVSSVRVDEITEDGRRLRDGSLDGCATPLVRREGT
jgi:hypothetical protein